jgi:hypothetical protein
VSPSVSNPFIQKANEREARRIQCHKMAWGHYRDLLGLLQRFTDKDDPETRERVRERVKEARRVADFYA